MKKFIGILFGVLLITSFVGFSGCIGGDSNNTTTTTTTTTTNELSGTLKIEGSTTVLPIAKEAAKQFMIKNPKVKVEVSGGGSGVGVKAAGQGLADIGMASREIKSAEKETYPELITHPVGLDGVAIVVNPANPVKSITKEQIKKIYAGEITNWKELGGNDAQINVYTRDEESGTREVFFEKALDKSKIFERATVVTSNGNMKSAVKGDENAIGYLSIGYIDNNVKGLEFEGALPTEENVKNGKYKVSRNLNMITNGEPKGLAKEYLDFVLSPEGQEIVKKEGYMPIK
ncbi:phosphate binding protein [Methanococcus aeolicus Nankai-3]|uniref:Phosphate binding protein n=1 Tax=Methanococcus aeolicus (strain ATCC BAA-1280 / DSM 17508 / OCM 812 / Nankai-3) TaxID=419665 RepID=A6UTN7_META3|nr:phosphate ABC transporter substrate-binding protein [Methanococcus aeolicus]ABR55859.1 phosphate binding protein [Methanococcus aeolicus Nankai-3]